MSEDARRRAVAGLLADDRLGVVFAISEDGAWAGYAALTWGYSIEFRGRDAFIDELYLREPYRGRGIGSRVLEAIRDHAAAMGIRALHLEVDPDNEPARSAYARFGFEARDRFCLMSLKLGGGKSGE